MSLRIVLRRKTLLFSVAGLLAAIFCAVVGALPPGGWVLTSEFGCEDPALLCAEWEFPSGAHGEPCCITMGDFAANRNFCTSSDFR